MSKNNASKNNAMSKNDAERVALNPERFTTIDLLDAYMALDYRPYLARISGELATRQVF